MLSLCMYDLVYLISSMMIFSLPLLMPSLVMSVRFTYSIPYLLPLAHIAMTGSIYTTMTIAIERYITVCHPFFKISHNWSPSKYILPILTFSIAYNLPKFAELEVIQLEGRGLHFTFYILHFTFYILHFTFYILNFTFYILHFTFYIFTF
jgi:hypothetical protein